MEVLNLPEWCSQESGVVNLLEFEAWLKLNTSDAN